MNFRALRAPAVVAAAMLSLAAVGCTDTTVQPRSTVTGANVFNDPSSYQAFIARVYAGLAVSGQQGPAGNADIQGIDEGFSQYLRLYWECEELPTDEAIIGWNDVGLPEMNTQTWTSSSRMVVAMYYRIGVQTEMANDFLRQTSPAVLASRNVTNPQLLAQIQQWRAEARFLRALSYAHAIDLFGSVPLATENDPVGGAPPKQVTRDSLFKFVVSELKAVEDSLPTPSAANLGRATTMAAHMLLAELYLNDSVYTGTPDYADAMTEAATVINSGYYNLDPNWHHIFEADNQSSPEIIFPIESNGQFTQTYGGTTFLIHAECGGSMTASNYGIDYCWGGTRVKPEASGLFAAGDRRGNYLFKNGQTDSVYSIGNFNNGYALTKFTNVTSGGNPGSNPTFVDTWFPLFRLSGAYLTYAEAAVRTNTNTATALGYVNQIRERAYGCNGACVAADWTTTDLTLPNLLAERGRELMWEAHRRTDLVRYGLFTGSGYLWSWKGESPQTGSQVGLATDSHLNLYPLPATELVTNPNLKQNPGYN